MSIPRQRSHREQQKRNESERKKAFRVGHDEGGSRRPEESEEASEGRAAAYSTCTPCDRSASLSAPSSSRRASISACCSRAVWISIGTSSM